jgi:DNA polymerase
VDAPARAESLRAHAAATAGCTACALAETREVVVVGRGAPDAELMLVAEAPGFQEERAGAPIAGEAGALVERLLRVNGIEPDEVYLTTVVKCRPPAGRDPRPEEVAACEPHLFRQVDLVRPTVVATLGTFATQLLTGRSQGITRVHGEPQSVSVGSCRVTVLPLYSPAAALYTPTMLRVLEEDVARIPALLSALGGSSGVRPAERGPIAAPAAREPVPTGSAADVVQLGLF